MTLLLCILCVGAAFAQTPPAPNAVKPPVSPPIATGTAPATPPTADKPADKTALTPPGVDKAPAAPPPPAETFQSSMQKQRAAMAIQRESVRKQSEMAAQWHAQSQATLPAIEAPEADCAPIAEVELTPLIGRAAQQHQLDTKLLRGVMEQESAFRPCAISPKGAKGLTQLMPATIEQFKVEDVFDPQQNIEAGATFLRQLLDKYKGDFKLALAAYNAGPANVDKTGGIPDIKETRDYVEGIMKKMQ